jgi:hypothetical protein
MRLQAHIAKDIILPRRRHPYPKQDRGYWQSDNLNGFLSEAGDVSYEVGQLKLIKVIDQRVERLLNPIVYRLVFPKLQSLNPLTNHFLYRGHKRCVSLAPCFL